MKILALAVLASALCACTPARPARTFALEGVVRPAIAALEAEVARERRPDRPAEPGQDDRVRALALELTGAHGPSRELRLADFSALGEAAVPILAAFFSDPRADDAQRAAAIDALAAIDTPNAIGVLARELASSPHAWARAHAARAIGRTHQDQIVPGALLRLKYETDAATVIELATTLAHFANYSGVDDLFVLRGRPEADIARAATERLAALARDVGVVDATALWRLWNVGDLEGRLSTATPSARQRLEVWRWIATLAESDAARLEDARFVLSRSAEWVVDPLCRALHDTAVSTRVHAAQCLERMGARACGAGPVLVAALEEPELAPAAAHALGWIAYPMGAAELARRLERDCAPDLRLAVAQALGPLGLPIAIEPLQRALAHDEPIALRQAAAQSLIALGETRDAVALLIECMTLPSADATTAEATLERWLSKLATPAGENVFTRWSALASPPHTEPEAAAISERRRARAELVGGALARLLD